MDDRGFSLVDALVAGAILAGGLAALGQVFVIAARASAAAGQMTTAAMLAAQKAEELRSLPWGEAAGGGDRVGAFTRRWTIVPHAAHPAHAIVIDVSVAPGAARVATLRARVAP